MPGAVVPVRWEVSTDESFRSGVRKGTAYADPDWAHSVHAEIEGLDPATNYWYRFTAGNARSVAGRTRTAPAPGATNARLRIAVASCQQYEQGFYAAYRHMLDDDLDLVLHVGDYIYESSWGRDLVRSHRSPETYTLEDYRARHALYRTDRDLAAAHAACPWMVTWDDHEVDNDYAADISEEDDVPELFLARRAAAYRAYYEHMPLPRRAIPFGASMRLHATRRFGTLANVVTLDERQYRSPLACPRPGRRGANRVKDCAELWLPERTKLGAQQERWFEAQLTASQSLWNLTAEGTVIAYIDEQPGPGEQFWTDGWNGYPAARQRLLESTVRSGATNPVFCSGDIHAFLVSNLQREPADPKSPVVAAEFTTTSISSQAMPQEELDKRRQENPSVVWANSERRGYLRLDLDRKRLQADLVAMDSVTRPDAGRSIQASFVVEAGQPGVKPA
jgi:alkaline phosphatase D